MERKKVSVILPTYNRGYIIKDAIASVLCQTYENIELLVVDDCSDDDTEQIVKALNDSRVKYFKSDMKIGANCARNIGCKNATGEYLAFIDSDNIWLQDKLISQIDTLESQNADCVFSRVSINSPVYGVFEVPEESYDVNNIKQTLKMNNVIDLNTFVVKKSVLEEADYFNETLPRFQDWELVIRLIIKNGVKVAYNNKLVCKNRILEDSIGRNFQKKIDGFIQIMDRYGTELGEDSLISNLKGLLCETNSGEDVERILNGIFSYDKKEVYRLEKEKTELLNENNQLRGELEMATAKLELVHQSTSWKITKPIRFVGRLLNKVTKVKFVSKIKTVILIIKEGGIKKLLYTIKHYREIKENQKRIEQLSSSENISVDSEYQDNEDYSNEVTDVKMLAFHLPQYHTFPENDEWWGKGFTEWNNVRKGDCRFIGHYQPRVPHDDIGYYDLSKLETLKKQVMLAKQHGIYGFCFYYYWFSGKRLMEKPVDMLLNHPEIDFPFCLCWANENWTRAWDGQNRDVLIAQEYSEEDDERFIIDLKKYIDDKRYIKINDRPLVVVYNPGHIPNCKKTFARWRETARKCGLGEILIWTCQTANNTAEKLGIAEYIDAEIEFPPHNYWQEELAVKNVDLNGKSAFLFSYSRLVDYVVEQIKNDTTKRIVPLHRGCMMAWDNAARRKDAWFTYTGFSLKKLYEWVVNIAEDSRKRFDEEDRFIFINAWNEWGEGTYLEPDKKYGYANINTVSKALFKRPLYDDVVVLNDDSLDASEDFIKGNEVKIAVQVHMFYLETLDETIKYLNRIPYKFDCFFSTDTDAKKKTIEEKLIKSCKAEKVTVEVFENRGRDVAPFISQMSKVHNNYEYICHIHSKKTKTNEHGNEWREYIFSNLFGCESYIRKVFRLFENDKSIGILMPPTYPVLEYQAEWGGNKDGVESVLNRLGVDCILPEDPVFPVGNMFWMRTEACKNIFEAGLCKEDFPVEAGQVNATIAHQIERSWVYIAKSNGYSYKKIFNNVNEIKELKKKKRCMIYVHYDASNELKDSDIDTIKCFSHLCDSIYFVSNSNLDESELLKLDSLANKVIKRENHGFDFGAWKDVLLSEESQIKEFDELILANNSFFAPIYSIDEMFEVMEAKKIDFWGNTIFPYSPDGSYIGENCIEEHIQSYFMVFNKSVINDDVFWDFWRQLPLCYEFIEVVAKCESKFTKKLSDAGFTYEPYIKESYYLSRFLNNYAIPYEKPYSLVLLKDPFVKKKCYQYMDVIEKVKLEAFISAL